MGETANIAEMASKISKDIFGVFGWTKVGPTDMNWDCTDEAVHATKTHPTDVVFWYDDPYQDDRVYVNIDLKSYATGTILKSKITSALQSLAKTVECANSGEKWKALYVDSDINSHCEGALFIYNHDGEFDRDFRKLLNDATTTLRIPKGRRICVFGPAEIEYLYNIATDILTLRGKEELPGPSKCDYWYPDLVTARWRTQKPSAATLEMLTGPWIVLRANGPTPSYFIWYRSRGSSTVDHFKYLLDFVFRYQVLSTDDVEVTIRLVGADADAITNFAQAREQYARMMHLEPSRLKKVTVANVDNVRRSFDEREIGMEG